MPVKPLLSIRSPFVVYKIVRMRHKSLLFFVISFWGSQAPDKTGSAAAAVGEATGMTWTPVSVLQKNVAGNAAQETYSPRFVAYLARFLLNYDGWVGSLAPLVTRFVLFLFHTPLPKKRREVLGECIYVLSSVNCRMSVLYASDRRYARCAVFCLQPCSFVTP